MESVTMWIFRMAMYSKKRTRVTQQSIALSDWEYAIPMARAEAERQAEADLRALEGVTPETPIERIGWRYWDAERRQ